MISYSERARMLLADSPSTLKNKVKQLIERLDKGENFQVESLWLKHANKQAWLINVNSDIKLLYSKEGSHITIHDIFNKDRRPYDIAR
ncbi:MAG: hypothetical protein WAX77_05675 [Methylococcaceae bacterium]